MQLQAGDWLRKGFYELERFHSNREEDFYRNIETTSDGTMALVEDFDRREKVLKLQGVQYLLNHLVERGVAKYVPSLEKHLANLTNILAGLFWFVCLAIFPKGLGFQVYLTYLPFCVSRCSWLIKHCNSC